VSARGWFKTLRPNGCWRLWDAKGIVQAQRMPQGPNAPIGVHPEVVRWRVKRVEPIGSRLQGWGLSRKEAYAVLLAKEAQRCVKRSTPAIEKVNACTTI
jgi:hypothetical protein